MSHGFSRNLACCCAQERATLEGQEKNKERGAYMKDTANAWKNASEEFKQRFKEARLSTLPGCCASAWDSGYLRLYDV